MTSSTTLAAVLKETMHHDAPFRKIILLLLFCLMNTASAMAQDTAVFRGGSFDPPNVIAPMTPSSKEELLISFYRNTGQTPDFKRWSFLTKNVLEAADFDRAVIALNEQVRLQTDFQNTLPEDLLVIRAPVDVSRYSSGQEVLFLPDFGKRSNLTQEVYGEKMALIIKDLNRFEKIAMTDAQASRFYNALREAGDKTANIPAFVELVVKPVSAVFSKEGRVGKGDHYLFVLDLAQVTIWREAGSDEEDQRALWSWRADWYKIKDDNTQLLQLYKGIN